MIDKTLLFRQTKKVRHYFWKHFVRKTAVSTQNNAPSTQKKRPWLKIVLTAVLFLITGMLTQFMSNTAAAALLCPIGLSIAESLGASPTAVVLAIGFSASAAYMTPIAINGCYCYVIARQKNGRG